jgi:transposase InsO family protein
MRTELVTDALKMAAANHDLEPGCIMHSDRGTQYQCPSVKRSWVRGGPVGDRRRRLDVLAS